MTHRASRRAARPATAAWTALIAAALALALALLPAPPARADDAPAADAATVAPTAGPVPNVIITNFTYGDAPATVGGDFTLGYTFQNMGRVAVQNMVVTVDGGDSFSIAGGTNTFYVDWLDAGYSLTQSVPMQALGSAASGAHAVTVGFRYEYVDAGVRSTGSSDIRIAVPVVQPDRFQINDPVLPESAYAGEEVTVTMAYVNKGKADVANVEASIEGESIESAVSSQYLGNVASGGTGSVGFAFTPLAAGELNATLHISYEDPNGEAKTRDFPITLNVDESVPVIDEGMDPEPEPEPAVPLWAWIAGGAALAVLAVALAVVAVRRRRARHAARRADDEDWDDWDGGDPEAGGADGGASGDAGVPDGSDVSGGPSRPDDDAAARSGDPAGAGDVVALPGGAPSADGERTQVIADGADGMRR